MIPCPFSRDGETSVSLIFTNGDQLQITACGITVAFSGEPAFVEYFPFHERRNRITIMKPGMQEEYQEAMTRLGSSVVLAKLSNKRCCLSMALNRHFASFLSWFPGFLIQKGLALLIGRRFAQQTRREWRRPPRPAFHQPGLALPERRLAIWELMLYVAGAGITFALPGCFRLKAHCYADMIYMDLDANWFSLGLCYLSLAMIMLAIYRKSRQ